MQDKISLNDIVQINKNIENKQYKSKEEFLSYIDIIQNYIDETFIRKDIILKKLIEYCENSGRFMGVKLKNNLNIELHCQNINDYFSITKKAIENAIFTESYIFNHFVFIEIKSIFKYIKEKSYSINSLKEWEILYGINTVEFHQQNESFKYLYTIFDKLTYVANHLNNKYFKKEQTEGLQKEALKFSLDFIKDISFLTKNANEYQKLNDILEEIIFSNSWHYIRKLRNLIEHDFVDPTNKFNITFSLDLLFIIVGRILLALNDHLKSDEEIKELLEKLRDEK